VRELLGMGKLRRSLLGPSSARPLDRDPEHVAID
jgi:hypothetical protein